MAKTSRETGLVGEHEVAARDRASAITKRAAKAKRAPARKPAERVSYEPPPDFAERTADLILRTAPISAKA